MTDKQCKLCDKFNKVIEKIIEDEMLNGTKTPEIIYCILAEAEDICLHVKRKNKLED